MAADKVAVVAWLRAIAGAVISTESTSGADDAATVAARLDAAASLSAPAFAAEMVDLTRIVAENGRTEEAFAAFSGAAGLDAETEGAVTVLLSIGLALMAGRVTWPSRPAARAARIRLRDAGDTAFAVAGPLGPDLYGWLRTLNDKAVRLVSEIAATSAPMVRVSSGLSLPSTVLAHQLYGDAKRADGLVDVAGASTPMLMPAAFDALGK